MRKTGSIVAMVAITLMALGFATQALADTTAEITELEHKCASATTVDEAMKCLRRARTSGL